LQAALSPHDLGEEASLRELGSPQVPQEARRARSYFNGTPRTSWRSDRRNDD
jgi:hypothetical protein